MNRARTFSHQRSLRNRTDLLFLATSAAAGLLSWNPHSRSVAGLEEASKDPHTVDPEKQSTESLFDFTHAANVTKKEVDDFWHRIVTSDPSRIISTKDEPIKDNMKNDGGGFGDMVKKFMGLVTGSGKESAIEDLVATARQSTEQGEVEDTTTFTEILDMLETYKDSLGQVVDSFSTGLDFTKLSPTSIFYYLELEDERKNPSWKRRAHRFCSGIDVDKVVELNCALQIALLSYADTVDEIRAGLEIHTIPHELVYAEARSEPGQPAHFIAIKRDQSSTSPTLEVLMGVRGTKTVADAITDILCDVEDYKGGKAHSFILASGKFLVEKHTKLLEELLTKSGKSKVKLTLIGHSLGAGVASIAGLEFKDNPKFEVEVLGFGCPALLSKELAEKADCITTVINDSDMVPRMSGIAIANLLLNVMEFDWLTYAQRDVDFAVEELQARQGFIFNDIVVAKIRELVDPMLDDFADHTIKTELTEKVVPELYPPGKCIHFYRDGSGISGNFVPNTFFGEIDVTRRMIDDHLIHSGYQQTFLQLVRQHKGDHHFRFDESEVDPKA